MKKVKTLISSGVWNSVTQLSQTLSNGLDLLVSNLFISSLAMGQLAVAQTLENILNLIVSSVSRIFAPKLTYYYALNDLKSLLHEVKQNMLITSAFANIPFCVLLVLGKDLIELWLPTQDINMIHTLLVLTIFSFFNSPVITGLYNIFLITDNLKVNSVFWLCASIINIIIVFILLNATSLGVFAVAGVSTVTGFIANMTFVPMYAAKCLNQKSWIFHPIIIRYLLVTTIMYALFYGIHYLIPGINNWLSLINSIVCFGILGLFINYSLLFTRNERIKIKIILKKKLLKSGS